MRTSLHTIIGRLRLLSEFEQEESLHTRRLILNQSAELMDLGNAAVREFLKEPSPVREALTAFLKALPAEYLQALVALLYSGRDDELDVVDYWKTIRSNFRDQADLAQAIVEKPDRMAFIDVGIQFLADTSALNLVPAALK